MLDFLTLFVRIEKEGDNQSFAGQQINDTIYAPKELASRLELWFENCSQKYSVRLQRSSQLS